MKRAIAGGRNVGLIARLPTEELRALTFGDEGSAGEVRLKHTPEQLPEEDENDRFNDYLEEFLSAIGSLDRDALGSALTRASLTFARPILVEQLLIPLLQKVGELWSSGFLRIVHERHASIVLRNFLGGMLDDTRVPGSKPAVVVATPVGQAHEFGVLAASVMAAYDGWRVIYLGAEMPADEIAAATKQGLASVLALSLVYPQADPSTIKELEKMRRLVPSNVHFMVGGRSAEGYRPCLENINAKIVKNVGEFRHQLQLIHCEN